MPVELEQQALAVPVARVPQTHVSVGRSADDVRSVRGEGDGDDGRLEALQRPAGERREGSVNSVGVCVCVRESERETERESERERLCVYVCV